MKLKLVDNSTFYKQTKKQKIKYAKYICDCGNFTITRVTEVNAGRVKSCGCLMKGPRPHTQKHGQSRGSNPSATPTYNCWRGILDRCLNKNSHKYKNYGGKGIKVCDEWKSFINFYNDMGEKPQNKTIDRINNDGDYCKSNCKWSSNIEQQNNRSNNIFVIYKSKKYNHVLFTKKTGLSRSVFQQRIQAKWSPEEIFNTPYGTKRKIIKQNC